MPIRKAASPPELTPMEAACNMALLRAHEEAAQKYPKDELYFGVYRSRTFVVITRTTHWLQRIKLYVQWLFGLISYKQEDIAKLAERSKKQWVPAGEKAQLQQEMDGKVQQLEAAQNLLAQSKIQLQAKAAQCQANEQEAQVFRNSSNSWKQQHQRVQAVRAQYENLYKQNQNQIGGKDADIRQKMQSANDLLREKGELETKLMRAVRVMQHLEEVTIRDLRRENVALREQIASKDLKIRDLQNPGKKAKNPPAHGATATSPPRPRPANSTAHPKGGFNPATPATQNPRPPPGQ